MELNYIRNHFIDDENKKSSSQKITKEKPIFNTSKQKKIDGSLQDKLEKIKLFFGISTVNLGFILKICSNSAYALLKNRRKYVNKKTVDRINQIYKLTGLFDYNNLGWINDYFELNIDERNVNLFDLFTKDELDLKEIEEHILKLKKIFIDIKLTEYESFCQKFDLFFKYNKNN
jgi:hypothetical protein